MMQYATTLSATGHGMEERVKDAFAFVETLFPSMSAFDYALPTARQRFDETRGMDKQYLAHEYFNKDWEPCSFSAMNDCLSQAKLSYACSAHLMENLDVVTLTKEQQNVVNAIKDPVLQQVRDFMVNRQFRRDYWVKGLRQVFVDNAIRELQVILTTPCADVPKEINCPQGKIRLNQELLDAILAVLQDHLPHPIAELERTITKHSLPILWQTIGILAGARHIHPAVDCVRLEEQTRSKLLNRKIVRLPETVTFCASPRIGGGIAVSGIEQLFLDVETKHAWD